MSLGDHGTRAVWPCEVKPITHLTHVEWLLSGCWPWVLAHLMLYTEAGISARDSYAGMPSRRRGDRFIERREVV